MDTPIASDLSYFVAQKRRRESETGTPSLDNTLQRLYPVSGSRRFIADVDEGDCARPNLCAARASSLDLKLTPILPLLRER